MNGSLKQFNSGLNTGVWGSLDNIVNNKKTWEGKTSPDVVLLKPKWKSLKM